MKRVLIAFAIAFLLLYGTANAGGQRTIVVTGAQVGADTVISGCGYTKPEVSVYVYRESDGAEIAGFADAVYGACFEFDAGVLFTEPGSYEVEVFQVKGTAGAGSYNQNHASAYLDFEVVP